MQNDADTHETLANWLDWLDWVGDGLGVLTTDQVPLVVGPALPVEPRERRTVAVEHTRTHASPMAATLETRFTVPLLFAPWSAPATRTGHGSIGTNPLPP
jgi:hypothetical protein